MRVLGVRSNVCHSGGGITVGGEHNHILSHIIQFGADVIFQNPVMGRVLQERWLKAVAVPRQAHAGADGVQGQGGGC